MFYFWKEQFLLTLKKIQIFLNSCVPGTQDFENLMVLLIKTDEYIMLYNYQSTKAWNLLFLMDKLKFFFIFEWKGFLKKKKKKKKKNQTFHKKMCRRNLKTDLTFKLASLLLSRQSCWSFCERNEICIICQWSNLVIWA